jgi:hypothetical protein
VATYQIHINDLEEKITLVLRATTDEELILECEAWYGTIDIMRSLGLRFITLDDYGEEDGMWQIH